MTKLSERFGGCRLVVPSASEYSVVAITGGTGTFGRAMTRYLLEHASHVRVRCFSRDEYKQSQMKQEYAEHTDRLSFLLGDVRDVDRLALAFRDVDLVIHAAALKQVPALEYNPFEAVQTNIIGSANVIRAAIQANVKHAILLSSDKAVHPLNLYGATKLCAEKLFVQANVYAAQRTRFNVARYGNIAGSRGSVIEVYRQAIAAGRKLPVTDPNMTRFWMVINDAIRLVCFVADQPIQGGIFVPQLYAFRLTDLCRAMLGRTWAQVIDKHVEIIGLRPGEKLHEMLMTDDERRRAYMCCFNPERPLHEQYYFIPPVIRDWQEGLSERSRADWVALASILTSHGSGILPYVSDQWNLRFDVKQLAQKIEAL